MSKMLVVKANNIIEASYQLSLNEQRLILAAISCIPKGEEVTDNTGYCVTRESFIELGINPKLQAGKSEKHVTGFLIELSQ